MTKRYAVISSTDGEDTRVFRSEASLRGRQIIASRQHETIREITEAEARERGVTRYWPAEEDRFESLGKVA